jgi:hypothetical protein
MVIAALEREQGKRGYEVLIVFEVGMTDYWGHHSRLSTFYGRG